MNVEGKAESVRALVAQLADASRAEAAATFPRHPADVNQPGLYSWWCDDEGLRDLSAPFGVPLAPLIYAGQTGATSTRSHNQRITTLRDRIGGNHLHGNVGSSTFRQTLTAVLLQPLELRLAGSNHLESASNAAVSRWMRQHLSVMAVPYPDRDTLAAVEDAVLAYLDPPFNLMGMPDSDIRRTLRRLRRALSTEGRQ